MLRRLVGYAAIMFGANTVTGLLNFGVSVLGMVTREKETFGQYATYMLVYGIGQGFFIFGVNASVQKYGADSEEHRLRFAAMALWLFLALTGVMAAIGIACGYFWDWNVALGFFGLPFVVIWWWSRYLARCQLDARREAQLMAIASLANTLFQFVLLTTTELEHALIYGDFFALVASGILGITFICNAARRSPTSILRTPIPKTFLAETARFGLPMWWAGQIMAVGSWISGVAVRGKLGSAQMGAFNASQTMWQFTQKPMEYLGGAALPAMVAEKNGRSELYRDVLRLCLVAFTLCGIAVAAGVPLLFQMIDHASSLFGHVGPSFSEKYAEIPLLLLPMATAVPIQAFGVVANQFSIAEDRPKVPMYSQLAGVVAAIALIYPMTMRFGLLGVVLSALLAGAFGTIAYPICLFREYRSEMRAGIVGSGVATACCVAALVPVYLLRDWEWRWVAAFPATGFFLLCMLLFGIVTTRDFVRLYRASVRKRTQR